MFDSRLFLPICTAALLLCAACSPHEPALPVSSAPDVSAAEQSAPDTSVPADFSSDVSLPDESSAPAILIPEPSAPEVPVQKPNPEPPPVPEAPQEPVTPPAPAKPTPPDASASDYDFSQPAPEHESVGMDYFSDAAFIGDSRSEGFYLYAVKRGKSFSGSGLSVFTFAQKKFFNIGGKSYTGLQALALKDYGKVYLGFGVNELGYVNTEKFYQAYCDTIDAVRACQPYAVVYAQTMAPVNEAQVAANGGAKHLNNDRVRMYNDLIRKAAQEKCVPLLDIYSVLAVDGSLPAEAGRDGIHIHREHCLKQLDYLMRHTVDFDTLYPQPEVETEPEPKTESEAEVPVNETTDTPTDSAVDADSLLPQPDQSAVPAEPAPTTAGN